MPEISFKVSENLKRRFDRFWARIEKAKLEHPDDAMTSSKDEWLESILEEAIDNYEP